MRPNGSLDCDGEVGPIDLSIVGILPRREATLQVLRDHFMLQACESVIAELELAVKDDLLENRTKTLRRITDLFINDAERLNDEQIQVFDDVLCLLIRRIEGRALVELSNRLAPVDNSPIEVIRRLAWDEDVAVAEPVLAQSRRLPLSDLIEISAVRSQAHLLAICGRYQLPESVTDVLLSRGDEEVVFKLATNTRARFSQTGYGILVDDAEGDDRLTETVALRFDIPQRLLRELLERATEAVRSRILALAPPETRDDIQRGGRYRQVGRQCGGDAARLQRCRAHHRGNGGGRKARRERAPGFRQSAQI
jgi:uncharacterized protein (DUF2336 family)